MTANPPGPDKPLRHEGPGNESEWADALADDAQTQKLGRLRPRALALAVIVLAVALLAGGVFAVLQTGSIRHLFQWSMGGHTPTRATTSVATPNNRAAPVPAPPPGCPDTASLLASMSSRDKLAQLLMVGVTGATDARTTVATQHVGGIFVGNFTDLSMLKDGTLAEIAGSAGPLGLAVGVDEEGGRVQRLSSLMERAPSARVLAQGSPEHVYQLALNRGRQMRGFGITIDFAPVVDVTDAPDDTVIGDRAFSDDPAVVTQYAGAYANGLRDAGVLPVLKHFPGHGRASGDSHATGVVTPPLGELQSVDLVPYRSLVARAPVGVMIGHMQVPGLTGSDPASLNPAAVALLRNGIGYGGPPFDGPIFTDDLSSMKAITDRYGVAEAVLKALQAGEDTALWITTTEVPAVLDRLQSALAAGELSLAKIEASVQRMAKAKVASNSRCGQ
jgi:beta-N-acetylhexosaminidase